MIMYWRYTVPFIAPSVGADCSVVLDEVKVVDELLERLDIEEVIPDLIVECILIVFDGVKDGLMFST